MNDELFPKMKKEINKLIEDEEGNIPGGKLLMLGTMIVVLGSLMSIDAFADHRSHSSHKSHSSHSSGSGSYNHGSHESHQSHQSAADHSNHSNAHSSHSSHTSHSNTARHSNSKYSSEGDVTYGPDASSIKGVSVQPATAPADSFHLPKVNENIQNPDGTPISSIIPAIGVPDTTALGNVQHEGPIIPPETGDTGR